MAARRALRAGTCGSPLRRRDRCRCRSSCAIGDREGPAAPDSAKCATTFYVKLRSLRRLQLRKAAVRHPKHVRSGRMAQSHSQSAGPRFVPCAPTIEIKRLDQFSTPKLKSVGSSVGRICFRMHVALLSPAWVFAYVIASLFPTFELPDGVVAKRLRVRLK